MSKNKNLECPNCKHQINVEDVLFQEAEEKLRNEFKAKEKEQADKYKKREEELERAQQELKEKKERENELFQERLNKAEKLIKEKEEKKATEANAAMVKALQEDVEKQKAANQKFKQMEVDMLNMKTKMAEERESIELEIKKKVFEERESILKKAKQSAIEEGELKLKEKDKQLADQKKLIDEMKRKAEQGSMQLQGEVQELALEELLGRTFPFDDITEVSKGMRGADCLQHVKNTHQHVAGKIVYESKRTKAWSNDWIDKLKADRQLVGADLAVLVTDVFPKGMERFGLKNDVWICSYHEVEGLAMALRESILKVSSVKASQENKGGKMELLYDFLSGDEFRQQIESIVDGFTNMKNNLETEKRSMQRIWKSREKEIEKVITNTINMYGSMKGIAGNAIQDVKQLELPEGDGELDL